VKAGQDRERQKNEGQSYANDVIPRARGAAARLLLEADGYRQRVVASADGETNRFKQVLTEYSKAPQITRDRIYIDTMQQMYANTSKVMVDIRNGSQLLYLPLDKLIQQTGDAAAATAAAQQQAQEPPVPRSSAGIDTPTPGVEARSRDAQRNRDRETR
jgi:membrane protease subunit HflK